MFFQNHKNIGASLKVELGLPVYEYAVRKDELWVSVETYLGTLMRIRYTERRIKHIKKGLPHKR